MHLNLSEIINIPGSGVDFDYEVDVSHLHFDGVERFLRPCHVVGEVKNHAGIIELTADVSCDMNCICDRCLTEFHKALQVNINSVLSADEADVDNPDVYYIENGGIDLDEIVITEVVLNMDQRFLCREDCKGLCPRCGANLNDGPCDCKKEIDPRLAALQQFLENE